MTRRTDGHGPSQFQTAQGIGHLKMQLLTHGKVKLEDGSYLPSFVNDVPVRSLIGSCSVAG